MNNTRGIGISHAHFVCFSYTDPVLCSIWRRGNDCSKERLAEEFIKQL